MSSITQSLYTATTTNSKKAPRKGQRVIVHGLAGGSCTPAPGGGQYATYVGTVAGHWAFEGLTADKYFVTPGAVRWEAR